MCKTRLVIGLLTGLCLTGSAWADTATTGADRPARQRQGAQDPDFLFGQPRFSIGVRGAWVRASANSEIFDFTTDLLTLDKDDFDGPALGVDVGVALASRLDGIVGFEFAGTRAASEYRDFVDTDGLPITQTTSLTQLSLGGSVELAVLPRGRAIGQFAWVPRRVVPYVGVGGGWMWYEFEQEGDFIDFTDFAIFSDRFRSAGWTPSGHVYAGLDVGVTRRLALTAEARYVWASTELGQDFVGFDEIDLNGLRISGGVQFAF